MNPYMYMKTHSKDRLNQVCELAGTKPSWFSLCARGHGEFSMSMAVDIEAASRVMAEVDNDYITIDEIFNLKEKVDYRIAEITKKVLDNSRAA